LLLSLEIAFQRRKAAANHPKGSLYAILRCQIKKLPWSEPGRYALESAFQTAKQKQVGAITMIATPPFFAERKRIVELAGKNRLPAIYWQKEFVDEGGLMSYGADFDDLYRRAAVYVDKILKGAKPADLPVEQATKFEFIINLKAAKQIGLTLSPEFLARANQVIK
jgi:putative tryptophan/tyrosine transport system substrate-binding protein